MWGKCQDIGFTSHYVVLAYYLSVSGLNVPYMLSTHIQNMKKYYFDEIFLPNPKQKKSDVLSLQK